jgi:hypothetical protein
MEWNTHFSQKLIFYSSQNWGESERTSHFILFQSIHFHYLYPLHSILFHSLIIYAFHYIHSVINSQLKPWGEWKFKVWREMREMGVPSYPFYSLLIKLPNQRIIFLFSPLKLSNKEYMEGIS